MFPTLLGHRQSVVDDGGASDNAASCLITFLVLQGFSAQSAVTGEGPYANWAKHVTDPFGYNLLTVLGNEDRLPSL